MNKIQVGKQTALTLTGRPFSSQLMDAQTSLCPAILQLQEEAKWQKLREENPQAPLALLLVFGGEDFMAWYGLLGAKKSPGMLQFVLPAAQTAQRIKKSSSNSFLEPLNKQVPDFLQAVQAAGTTTYANLGDSPTPYLLQFFLEPEKIKQLLYLKELK